MFKLVIILFLLLTANSFAMDPAGTKFLAQRAQERQIAAAIRLASRPIYYVASRPANPSLARPAIRSITIRTIAYRPVFIRSRK